MRLLKIALTWVIAASVALAQIPITQLPPATLPLTGTEKVPMVQNNKTVQAPANSVGTPLINFGQVTALWTAPCSTSTQFLNGAGTCTSPITSFAQIVSLWSGCTTPATQFLRADGNCALGGSNIIALPYTTSAYFGLQPTGTTPSGVQWNYNFTSAGDLSLNIDGPLDLWDYSHQYNQVRYNAGGLISSIVSTPGSSPTAYPVAYAAQGNVNRLTTLPAGLGSGNNSFVPFAARNTNSAGYTALVLQNDLALGTDLTSFPNSLNCCNVPNGTGQAEIIYFGSTSIANATISNTPGGANMWFGTSGTEQVCMGTFGHCIMSMDGTDGHVLINEASSTANVPALKVVGAQGTAGTNWGLEVIGTGLSGNSYGAHINGGGTSGDQTLLVDNHSGINELLIRGDGSGILYSGNNARQMNWDTGGHWTFTGSSGTGDMVTITGGSSTNARMLNVNALGTSWTVPTTAALIRTPNTGSTGNSNDLQLVGGTNSSDWVIQAFTVPNQTTAVFQINGDSSGQLGPASGSHNLTWNSNGAFAVNAPAAGIALSVTGVAGQFAELVTSAASGTENGLSVNAGSTNSDIALDVDNQSGATKSFRVFGDGSVVLNNAATEGVGTINLTQSNGSGYNVNGIPLTATFQSQTGQAVSNTDFYLGNSLAIPANALAVGNQFRITIWGQCTSTVANAVTFTVRYGAAGSTADASIGTAGYTAATTGTGNAFKVTFDVSVNAVGASGTFYQTNELINTAGVGISTSNTSVSIGATSAAVDTTLAKRLGVSLVSAAATTTFSIKNVIIERLF